jgi:hypothetical protein
MGTTLSNAKRARKLQRLFEAWRRAFEAQDAEAMSAARRAIDARLAISTNVRYADRATSKTVPKR